MGNLKLIATTALTKAGTSVTSPLNESIRKAYNAFPKKFIVNNNYEFKVRLYEYFDDDLKTVDKYLRYLMATQPIKTPTGKLLESVFRRADECAKKKSYYSGAFTKFGSMYSCEFMSLLTNGCIVTKNWSIIYCEIEKSVAGDSKKPTSNNTIMHIIGPRAKLDMAVILKIVELDMIKTVNSENERANRALGTMKYTMSIYSSHGKNDMRILAKKLQNIFSEQKKDVLDVFKRFSRNRGVLSKYGLSNTVGILLSGNPGTGKTELLRAASVDFAFNYVQISTDDVLADGLKSAMESCDFNGLEDDSGLSTIVILDDCEIYLGSRTDSGTMTKDSIESKKYENTAYLMRLLNDGIPSRFGIIIALTTNYKEKLDPALIRDGRIDYKVEMTDINEELAKDMVRSYDITDTDIILKDETFPINPAYLQNKISKYLLR